MKIDSSSKTIGSAQNLAGPRTTGVRPAAAKVSTNGSTADQSSAVVATAMHTVTGSESTLNAQKVAEIRQAISEGRFQINPERIADGLINSVREMLDQNRRPTST